MDTHKQTDDSQRYIFSSPITLWQPADQLNAAVALVQCLYAPQRGSVRQKVCAPKNTPLFIVELGVIKED